MSKTNIIHVMKDGTTLPSVAGHIVRESDAPEFYRLLDKINSQRVGGTNIPAQPKRK